MASSIVGALRVLLGIDTANFDKGVKDVQGKLRILGKSFKSFAAGLGATLTVGGIVAGFKAIINHMDNMGKAAQRLGIPIEELSRLKHAADIADVSFEELSTSMGFLSRNMLNAAQGSKQAQEAFNTLGIKVQNADGTMKSLTQIITEISIKFSAMSDGAAKTAMSMDLFGRSGRIMIPLLNAGATGLAQMMLEADRLGIVIDQKTATSAENFNDNLTRLRAAIQGVLISIIGTGGLGSALESVSNSLVNVANNGQFVQAVASGMSAIILSSASITLKLSAAFRELAGWATAVAQVFNLIKNNQMNFLDPIREQIKNTKDIVKELNLQLAALNMGRGAGLSGGFVAPPPKAIKGGAEPIITDLRAADKAAREAASAFEKLKAEGQRVWDATRTPLEAFQLEIRELNDLLQAGVIDSDTYGRAIANLQADFTGSKEVVQLFGDSLSSAFDNLIEGTFNLKDALNDLLKDLAKFFANRAIQSLLMGPGGGGGLFGNLFGGGRARGGSVSGRKSYLVGERGPELFSPGRSGMIFSNKDMATNIQIIDQRGAGAPAIERQSGAGGERFIIRDMIRNELPGELNRLMPSQFGISSRLRQRGG